MIFKPQTRLGKWSVGAAILALLYLLLFYLNDEVLQSSATGNEGLYPLISLLEIPAYVGALIAFLAGIISIIKSRELGALVFASAIIGLLGLLWLVIFLFVLIPEFSF